MAAEERTYSQDSPRAVPCARYSASRTERPTTTAPIALAAYAAMIAVRRSSPGRMRNPASSARSNLPGMAAAESSKAAGWSPLPRCCGEVRKGRDMCPEARPANLLENASEGGVAVEDRDAAALQAVRAPDAHVGGKDVSQHDLGAQLGAGAGVQLERVAGGAEAAVVERHPGIAHVAEDRGVQPAEVDRQRPGAGLDLQEREPVLEGAEDVGLAGERAAHEAAQDPHRSADRVQDAAHRIARVEPAQLEQVALGKIAAGDAARQPDGEDMVQRPVVLAPGQQEVPGVRGGQLAEGEVRSDRLRRDAGGEREPLSLFGRDAAHEPSRVRVDVGERRRGEESVGRVVAVDGGRVHGQVRQLVADLDRVAALDLREGE